MQKVRREAVQSRCRRRSVGVGESCGGSHAKVVEKSKKQGAAKRENCYSVTPLFLIMPNTAPSSSLVPCSSLNPLCRLQFFIQEQVFLGSPWAAVPVRNILTIPCQDVLQHRASVSCKGISALPWSSSFSSSSFL